MRNDTGTRASGSTTAEKRSAPLAAAGSGLMRFVWTACGACTIGFFEPQPASASPSASNVDVFLTLLISHRPAQLRHGPPIRRQRLLVLGLRLAAPGLGLEQVLEQRRLVLVL